MVKKRCYPVLLLGCSVMAITTGFELVNLGSIPSTPTSYIAFVYWTGHVGFQLMDTGSNPVRDANLFR